MSYLAGRQTGYARGCWECKVEGHAKVGGTLSPVSVKEIDPNVPDEREDLMRRACRMNDAWFGRREGFE